MLLGNIISNIKLVNPTIILEYLLRCNYFGNMCHESKIFKSGRICRVGNVMREIWKQPLVGSNEFLRRGTEKAPGVFGGGITRIPWREPGKAL